MAFNYVKADSDGNQNNKVVIYEGQKNRNTKEVRSERPNPSSLSAKANVFLGNRNNVGNPNHYFRPSIRHDLLTFTCKI